MVRRLGKYSRAILSAGEDCNLTTRVSGLGVCRARPDGADDPTNDIESLNGFCSTVVEALLNPVLTAYSGKVGPASFQMRVVQRTTIAVATQRIQICSHPGRPKAHLIEIEEYGV